MFELTRLKVRGFRGFVDEQEFVLDRPVVLLCGENHRGKSSTLNALEWCLFGDECVGKKTGIPERLGWEIANRYVPQDVAVTAEFNGPGGRYLVRRELARVERRTAGIVTLTLPDGTDLHSEEAERGLYRLFRSSFQDFMTTVYQHQEAIRAVLTEEPRQRNEAIDRLLGLSQYRELLRGIEGADLEKTQKTMDSGFENLRVRAEQSIRTLANLIKEEIAKASEKGIREEDITEREALRRAANIGESVTSLAQELGIAELELATPTLYEQVVEFRERAKEQIDGLWAQAPDVRKQEALAKKQQELASLRGKYDSAKAEETKTNQGRDAFVQEHGDETALQTAIEGHQQSASQLEEAIRKVSAKANLVREAIQYLETATVGTGAGRCPLCDSEAPDLLTHLKMEWQERIEKQVADLERQRQSHASEVERYRSLKQQLENLRRILEIARSDLEACITQVATVLGREIGRDEDPSVLLNARLTEIASELEAIRRAIEQKRSKISDIYEELANLRTIDEISGHQRKRAAIERIWETEEFAELSRLRDGASQLVEHAKAIRGALAAASQEEAKGRISAAGAALDNYFRRLANHPAIPGLLMDVAEDRRSGLNSYSFRGKDGTDPTPILSLGDLNCLALSLFLGLAEAMGETQPFAFLIMDDPTQGLGPEMKQQLVDVLEDIADSRHLIISTPDPEFRDLLLANITKTKVIYNFLDWTEKGGPAVSRTTS
jgi:DNA repair exonuclease SbcCD ATPase subunit